MDTIEYATFRYDTVGAENSLKELKWLSSMTVTAAVCSSVFSQQKCKMVTCQIIETYHHPDTRLAPNMPHDTGKCTVYPHDVDFFKRIFVFFCRISESYHPKQNNLPSGNSYKNT